VRPRLSTGDDLCTTQLLKKGLKEPNRNLGTLNFLLYSNMWRSGGPFHSGNVFKYVLKSDVSLMPFIQIRRRPRYNATSANWDSD